MIRNALIRGQGIMRGRPIAAFAVAVLVSVPALAQEAKQLEKSGDWAVFAHGAGAEKICFVVSQPKSQKPDGVKRGPVYFYVSSWTKDKVKDEISVKMGYPLKANVPAEIAIGSDKFELFTKDEGAYLESKDKEKALLDAMKKGSTMVVQGRSERGTLTTDEYSLGGVSAALERGAKECQ